LIIYKFIVSLLTENGARGWKGVQMTESQCAALREKWQEEEGISEEEALRRYPDYLLRMAAEVDPETVGKWLMG